MVLTTEEKKLRTLYQLYKRTNKKIFNDKVKIAKEAKKNILSISRTNPKGQRKSVKDKLLRLRRDIIVVPKWTSTLLTFPQWKAYQDGYKPSNIVKEKLKKWVRTAKAQVKGTYGTTKHFGFKNKAERKVMEKDAKKMRLWNDRFAFQGVHTPPEKLTTTMDKNVYLYYL